MLLALFAATLPDPLEQLLQALDVAAVAVLEALLQQPPERGPDVAVVHEVVFDLRQDRVGIEVEAGLGPVPPRVPVARPRQAPNGPGRSPGGRPRPC